jgi:hypothetical protein
VDVIIWDFPQAQLPIEEHDLAGPLFSQIKSLAVSSEKNLKCDVPIFILRSYIISLPTFCVCAVSSQNALLLCEITESKVLLTSLKLLEEISVMEAN